MNLKNLFAAAALIVFGAVQNANALTFSFTGSESTQSFFDVIGDDGVTSIHVTGFTSGGAKNINRDGDGMGVYQGGNDSDQTDGDPSRETIRFTFGGGLFTLVSVQFTRIGSDDDFGLNLAGANQGTADIPNSGLFVFGGTYTGTDFGFYAPNDNDDFKISALSFNVNQSNAVPEPATVGLLGLAMVAGLISRRRKAA